MYIGLTTDINRRLAEHDLGNATYTKKYAPWELKSYVVFGNKAKATEFERYLKSGSGFAFLKRRLI